jgi:hypothetical protein
LAHALNSSIGTLGDIQAQNEEQRQRLGAQIKHDQAVQAKAEGDAGEAAAQHDAGTGEQTDLQMHSDAFAAAYKQTDGLRMADDFGNALQADLARAEPGMSSEQVQKFIQDRANQFITDKQLDPTSQQSFFAAVSKATTGWKDQYNKQSIQESLKRDEENLGAIGTAGIKSGSLLTSEGFAGFHETLLQRGLNETEARKIMASSFAQSLASGNIDVAKAIAVLKTPIGSDGTVLADIPEFKGQLDLAAKRGQAVQDEARKKAQADQLTASLFHLSDAADQGLLSDAQINATRKQFDLTPEWAAGMHNRNREAMQRLLKENEKADQERMAYAALTSGDPVQIAAVGVSKVADAGSKVMAEAYKQGNDKGALQVAGALARANAPLPFFRQLATQFDASDPQNALRTIQFFQGIKGQSRDYYEANVPADFSAKLRRFEIETSTFGLSPEQALQKIAQTSPILDSGATSAAISQYVKQHQSVIPRDFGDSAILSGKFSSTPIQNQGYVNAQVQDIAKEMMSTGQLSAEDAMKQAVARFQATNVRVGDMYVPVPNGAPPQVGQAFTELSKDWKDRLVKEKQMDDTGTVYFQPAVNDPSKWVLMRNDDGVSRAVIKRDQHGTPDFVEMGVHDVLAKYHTWSTDKAVQDTTRNSALKKLGYGFLADQTEQQRQESLRQLASRPDEALGVTGMTFNGKLIADGYTHNRGDAARLKDVLDQTKTPTFIDYIHSIK